MSVVVTTRNRPVLANKAVLSALSQTLRDIEVVIVDDGSVPPFQPPCNDERTHLERRESSSGVCAARNLGMHAARGRWITFLDDDDELLPHMLEVSLGAAQASTLPQPVAVLSGIEVVDPRGRVIETRLPVTLSRGKHYFLEPSTGGTYGTQNTLLVPLDILRSIGGWDEEILSWEHDELFLRLNAVCSLQGVPAVTYRMRAHDGVRLHEHMLACAEAMACTVRKHRRLFVLHPHRYAHYLGAMGVAYLKAGRWGPAVAATTRSILRNPRRPRLWAWWIASLAGPWATSVYRAAKRRLVLARSG